MSSLTYSEAMVDTSNWRFTDDGHTMHWDAKTSTWREVEFTGTAPNQWKYKDQ